MGELFGTELRRLREAAGLSRSALSRRTVALEDMGISEAAIEALEVKPERAPEERTRLLLGRALAEAGYAPVTYALAVAREQLDEQRVGFEAAMRNLEAVRELLPGVPGAASDQELREQMVQEQEEHALQVEQQKSAGGASRRGRHRADPAP
jgi:hypothetical protein